MRWVIFALASACTATREAPSSPPVGAPPVDAAPPADRVPSSATWSAQALGLLGKEVRLPPDVVLAPRDPSAVLAQARIRMPSGYRLTLTAASIRIAEEVASARAGKDVEQVLVDAADAVVVVRRETPDLHRIGRYCEVSACGDGVCIHAEGATVAAGRVEKMTDDECLTAVAIIRSIRG